jgi:hypothetical protein
VAASLCLFGRPLHTRITLRGIQGAIAIVRAVRARPLFSWQPFLAHVRLGIHAAKAGLGRVLLASATVGRGSAAGPCVDARGRSDKGARALAQAADTSRAMTYLHKQVRHMIIHRDLKPANLLIGGAQCSKERPGGTP